MKLSIIVDDGAVYVDGVCKMPLDLNQCGIPENVWALQWKDVAGWIEFDDNPDGTKPANQPITELPEWANNCVTVWENYQPPAPPTPPTQTPPTISTTDQPITNGTQP